MSLFIHRAKKVATKMWLVFSLALLLSACGRNDAKVYEVPKENSPATAPGTLPAGHPDMSMASAAGLPPNTIPAKLTYTRPEGWTEVTLGQMRAASFNVKNEAGKQADISVIPLPGMAGGDDSNVNRWRGQVGLGTLSAEELAKVAEPVEIGGQPAKLYDQAGTGSGSGDPTRILGVIQHREGTAWFFKVTGDDALVAKEKAAFIAFLKSVKFEAVEAAASLPPGHPPMDNSPLPAGHPEISTAATPAAGAAATAVSNEGKPQWTVPTGWKEIPGGQFLIAKFTVGEGSTTAVNVSMSAGDGGGLLANVNRWRGQLGLSPWGEADLKQASEISVADGKATLVEMSGKDARSGQAATVVGAIVPRGGQTWFYKLMGDAKVVESQKAAFTQFVKEVKY
jgi:hypothetical protein